MSRLTVFGVDPGPIPGLCVLEYSGGALEDARALQCSPNWVYPLLGHEIQHGRLDGAQMILSVERYTPRRAATKMASPADGKLTQDMAAGMVTRWAFLAQKLAEGWDGGKEGASLRIVSYAPSGPLAWCTDHILEAAGLLNITRGSAHARAAARHAVYAAVKDGGAPNPLSRASRPT